VIYSLRSDLKGLCVFFYQFKQCNIRYILQKILLKTLDLLVFNGIILCYIIYILLIKLVI
jgi:hypothetical protein